MRCLTEQEQSEILRSSSADLFQSDGISLRMTNTFDNHNECCHPEQSEGRGGAFKKCAFTLAEVLITLGIIGVVAAMTIPSLINAYRAKELETRFKKADSIIQQALRKTANEAGYDSITDLEIPGRKVTDENFNTLKEEVEELNQIWESQFSGFSSPNYRQLWNSGARCHSMSGKEFHQFPVCWVPQNDSVKGYLLSDGLFITSLSAKYVGTNHPGVITFFFDTNGPYSGPNRWGYDLFIYYSTINYLNDCNPTLNNSNNERGCYSWAHYNINPKDNTSPYWKILYKPTSYWQK